MDDAVLAPRDFQEFRQRLIPLRPQLPKRLAQVADFAVEKPDEVAFGTAASIAEMAGVQPSTLVRFAQTLGYGGFSEMQDVFRARLRDRWPDYPARLEALREGDWERGGPASLLDGFVKAAHNSLAHLREGLDIDQLERATDILAGAGTIYLLGQRRAFPITAYLGYALSKLRLRTILVDNVGSLSTEQLGLAEKGDAVLSVSFTPYTPLTVELSAKAAERGVPVVAITDSPFSPLASFAKARLEVVESDFGGFRSLAASLCLAMSLAVAVAERRSNGTNIPS